MSKKSNRPTTSSDDYISYLNEADCWQIIEEFLENEFQAKNLQRKVTTSADKYRYNFKAMEKGKSVSRQATVYMNPCALDHQYKIPVIVPFVGEKKPIALKELLERVSPSWTEKSLQGWAEANEREKKQHIISPEEAAAREEKRKREREKADRLAQIKARDNYLNALVGTTFSQYVHLASKAQQHPSFHQFQRVKTPEKHPYIIKKQLEVNDRTGFLIVTPNLPSLNQLIKFAESDKFSMPKNEYAATSKDLVEKLKSLGGEYKTNTYIHEHNVREGIGIIESHDINGTVLSLQRILTKKFDGKDKYALTGTLTEGAMRCFDYENKIRNPNYQPNHIVINEGWASGETIDMAMHQDPQTMVVIAWSANQIAKVTELLGDKYPKAHITLAADNDIKSFVEANEKEPENHHLVKNTGIEAVISTYLTSKHANRISIITPPLPVSYEKNNISDFDDIRVNYGFDKVVEVLNKQFAAAADRAKAGVNEAEHYIKYYNEQAKHFANKHGITLNGIGKELGDIQFTGEPAQPAHEAIAEAKTEVKQTPQNTAASQPAQAAPQSEIALDTEPEPAMAYLSFEGLMRVDSINPRVKTDFDHQTELQAELLCLANQGKQPGITQEMQIQSSEPREIPFINPAVMTALLYESHLNTRISAYVDNALDRDEIVNALKQQPIEQDKASRLISAIIDPVMGEHVPKELEKVIHQYSNSTFYQDLKDIQQVISENHVYAAGEAHHFIKEAQQNVATQMISTHYDKGVDDELTQEIISKDILNQDLPVKQTFFKELRSCLRSLGETDEKWISQVKETLYESQHLASAIPEPTRVAAPKQDDTPSPGM